MLRCLAEGRIVTLADNVVLVSRDGTAIAIQDSAAPIQDRNGEVVGAVMVFHDVSQERQLHRKLAYLASHDSLTGFINRREFEERLSAALRAVQKRTRRRAAALLYMDLDQFKVVNDTCGHGAGDLLLRQLGDVLRARVPKTGVLARLGGDEFAVLLHDCSLAAAATSPRRLREAIASFRFSWRDNALQVGVSIGIVPVEATSESVGDAHERRGRRVLRGEGSRAATASTCTRKATPPSVTKRCSGSRASTARSRRSASSCSTNRSCRSAASQGALAALRAAAANARRARRARARRRRSFPPPSATT